MTHRELLIALLAAGTLQAQYDRVPTLDLQAAYGHAGNGHYQSLAEYRAALGLNPTSSAPGYQPIPGQGYQALPLQAAAKTGNIYQSASSPLNLGTAGAGSATSGPDRLARMFGGWTAAESRLQEMRREAAANDPNFRRAQASYQKNEARWQKETARIDNKIAEQQRTVAKVNAAIERATQLAGGDVPTRRVTTQTRGLEQSIDAKHNLAIEIARNKAISTGGAMTPAKQAKLNQQIAKIEKARQAEKTALGKDVAKQNARLDRLRQDRAKAQAKIAKLDAKKKPPPKPPRPGPKPRK